MKSNFGEINDMRRKSNLDFSVGGRYTMKEDALDTIIFFMNDSCFIIII